ncbi:MAG: helix-turn-helix transcriptional regulator [Lachnospiraceae bacterium]|nr:helix-turn-helix transcriptional regulator [Lachnospiraceae bacterium]
MARTNLYNLRLKAKLTQVQLSNYTGISIDAIRSYESGRRKLEKATLENIIRICVLLRCSICDIVNLDEIIYQYKKDDLFMIYEDNSSLKNVIMKGEKENGGITRYDC